MGCFSSKQEADAKKMALGMIKKAVSGDKGKHQGAETSGEGVKGGEEVKVKEQKKEDDPMKIAMGLVKKVKGHKDKSRRHGHTHHGGAHAGANEEEYEEEGEISEVEDGGDE